MGYLSSGQWYSLSDGSTPNFPEPTPECSLIYMMRTSETAYDVTQWKKLVMTHLFRTAIQSNLFRFQDENDVWTATSLVADVDTPYIVIIQRTSTNFEWTIHNLLDSTEQTETTARGLGTGTESYSIRFSDAQTGMKGYRIGHCVVLPTIANTAVNTVKTWMIEQYSGEQGTQEVSAEVFRLQDNQNNKVKCRQARDLDITFASEEVPFQPDDFVIDLEVRT